MIPASDKRALDGTGPKWLVLQQLMQQLPTEWAGALQMLQLDDQHADRHPESTKQPAALQQQHQLQVQGFTVHCPIPRWWRCPSSTMLMLQSGLSCPCAHLVFLGIAVTLRGPLLPVRHPQQDARIVECVCWVEQGHCSHWVCLDKAGRFLRGIGDAASQGRCDTACEGGLMMLPHASPVTLRVSGGVEKVAVCCILVCAPCWSAASIIACRTAWPLKPVCGRACSCSLKWGWPCGLAWQPRQTVHLSHVWL